MWVLALPYYSDHPMELPYYSDNLAVTYNVLDLKVYLVASMIVISCPI